MSVSTSYTATVQSTGDITYTQQFASAANAAASGDIDLQNLASGANTITPPNINCVGCIIIPPAANSVSLTLKGVTGDTGFRLHNTNPSVITLNSGSSTFCLTAGNTVTGIRFIWL